MATYVLGDPTATLRWESSGGPAILSLDGCSSPAELASALAGVAQSMQAGDELLPGAGVEFPPRKTAVGPDPTRTVGFPQARDWAMKERFGSRSEPPWLRSVFATNSATSSRHRNPGVLCRHQLFDAGPGTVSLSTTLRNARDAAADPIAFERSLRAPHRIPGDVGGYLDWRADRDASQAASAADARTTFGDPVLTWLGFMATRLSVLVARHDRSVSGLTPTPRGGERGNRLVWPVWRRGLRAGEIEVLTCHAAIQRVAQRPVSTPDDREQERDVAPRALGVNAVFESRRLAKGNNTGAYGPPTQLWPR
jgi:hypothetical protein